VDKRGREIFWFGSARRRIHFCGKVMAEFL